MRTYVVTGPHHGEVQDVPAPTPLPGEVVVDVALAGICGTDVEFFTGEMSYFELGYASYPLRLGHEWTGRVSALGDGVDPRWLGLRVVGDTMLGCGRCRLCAAGKSYVCDDRFEVGIRGGWPGALAEQLVIPASALHAVPDSVDDVTAALVEPGSNALRAVEAAAPRPGEPLLICGGGTIGVLCAILAAARGAEVHVLEREDATTVAAGLAGIAGVWTAATLPDLPFDAVIDASTGRDVPALALEVVQPGGRLSFIGLSGEPSRIDTRTLVLKDITAVGILSASPGLGATIEAYAAGTVDPTPVVAATVGLAGVGDALAGRRPAGAGPGPKILVDPWL